MDKKLEKQEKIALLDVICRYKICIESFTQAIAVLDRKFQALHKNHILEDIDFKNVDNILYNKLSETTREFKNANVDYMYLHDKERDEYFVYSFLGKIIDCYLITLLQMLDILDNLNNILVANVDSIVKISLKRRLKALKNAILGKGMSQNDNDPQYLMDVRQMKKQYAELLENFYNTPMAEMYIRTKVSQLEEEFGSEEQFRQIDSSKLEQWKELLLESYRMDMDFLLRIYKDGCKPMQEQYKKYLEKMGVDDVDITNEHGKSYFVEMMCSDVNITELALKGSDQLVYEIFVASIGLFADEQPDNGSEVKLVK
ncbi:MAG: hypothetical protein OSJ70_03765 [Bacilli bacterium]|nr:hypothetical protein [Bacilli bacterium]